MTTGQGRDTILFLAHAGVRVGDAPRIPPAAVGEHAIVWRTGKSKAKKTVVIPITDELRPVVERLLARLDRLQDQACAAVEAGEAPKPVPITLLTNSYGRPWTVAGIQTTVQNTKQAALEAAQKKHGPHAKTGLEPLRVDDLRGTAATNFIRAGLTLDEVATILGWSKAKVEEIALRYVTAEEVALAIVERMKRAKAGR